MPWHVEERDGEYCVIKDSDGKSAGCHPSREKANAQMRALYANEGTTAGLELDWGDFFEEEQNGQGPLRIEVGQAPDRAVEAIVAALTKMSERLIAAEERQIEFVEIVQKLKEVVESDREALVASIGHMTDAIKEAVTLRPDVVVNVPEFEFPEIPAPVVNVQPPEVTVQYTPQDGTKTIKIERDPLSGMIASATVIESES